MCFQFSNEKHENEKIQIKLYEKEKNYKCNEHIILENMWFLQIYKTRKSVHTRKTKKWEKMCTRTQIFFHIRKMWIRGKLFVFSHLYFLLFVCTNTFLSWVIGYYVWLILLAFSRKFSFLCHFFKGITFWEQWNGKAFSLCLKIERFVLFGCIFRRQGFLWASF